MPTTDDPGRTRPARASALRFPASLAGVLLPPVIWLAHLTVVYALTPLACGALPRFPLHLATAVALLGIAASAGWGWAAAPPTVEDPGAARARFLAWVGLGFSGLAAVAVLFAEIAIVLVHPCLS